jgi:hypothetical protein
MVTTAQFIYLLLLMGEKGIGELQNSHFPIALEKTVSIITANKGLFERTISLNHVLLRMKSEKNTDTQGVRQIYHAKTTVPAGASLGIVNVKFPVVATCGQSPM